MATISAAQRKQNALKLSAWIATQHPALFRQLVAKVGALQRSPLGRLGYFGDDSSITDASSTDLTFTPDLPPIEIGSGVSFDSSAAYTPELSDVSLSSVDPSFGGSSSMDLSGADSISSAIAAPSSSVDTSAPATSGSFWDSIGAGVASATSAVGKVASALISPGSIAAVGGVAAAYFTMQGKNSQTSAQNAVLQAQLARTAQGAPPAGISYVRNPATGQVVPVYNTPNGQMPVTGSLLNTLANPTMAGTVAGIPTPYLLIGGGLLVLTVILSARR